MYEVVFTVSDWYDGPRQGVADFQGRPHFYDCLFGTRLDGYTDQFRLTPISPSDLDLVLEDWAIWRRWERAFHSGETTQASHPALPAERARHEQLKSVLKHVLQTNTEQSIIQTGVFRATGQGSSSPGVMRDLEVKWSAEIPEHLTAPTS